MSESSWQNLANSEDAHKCKQAAKVAKKVQMANEESERELTSKISDFLPYHKSALFSFTFTLAVGTLACKSRSPKRCQFGCSLAAVTV